MNIWSVATKKLVVTAVIGPNNASAPEAGFAYVDLATPVVLEQGQAYYVTQTCHASMPDKFTNSDANVGAADQQLARLGTSVYSAAAGVFPTIFGHGSQFAGVATFKANIPANPHPAPVRRHATSACCTPSHAAARTAALSCALRWLFSL